MDPRLREVGEERRRDRRTHEHAFFNEVGERPVLTLGVVQRKGGVGKSTSTLNLAAEFAARGQRVLAVDADPQATLTVFAGLDPLTIPDAETLLAAIVPEALKLPDDYLPTPTPTPWGADLIPASPALVQAEAELMRPDAVGGDHRLAHVLGRYADSYDVALIDCGPSLGKLTINALVAADFLLVPTGGDDASIQGLKPLFATLQLIQNRLNPKLQIAAAFPTLVRNTRHHNEVRSALAHALGDVFVPIPIPLSVAVQDSQVEHKALRDYDSRSKAALAYGELADEILERIGLTATRRKKVA